MRMSRIAERVWIAVAVMVALAFGLGASTSAEGQKTELTEREKPIAAAINTLRSLDPGTRSKKTKELALAIRALAAESNPHKGRLALGLAGLSTEGDAGHETLQEVTTTLAESLKERSKEGKNSELTAGYIELATLAKYEHVSVSLDDPGYQAAVAKLDAEDKKRKDVSFTLKDLDDKEWSLKDLKGNVVLVNFWATWCPPCRSEMPDLNALYRKYMKQGFVVLAITDDDESKVRAFVRNGDFHFPVLLDGGKKVNEAYMVEGIPKSFVYDRDGKLAGQAIDMRTKKQFEELLGIAGLK
jgi:peroxiredoxin